MTDRSMYDETTSCIWYTNRAVQEVVFLVLSFRAFLDKQKPMPYNSAIKRYRWACALLNRKGIPMNRDETVYIIGEAQINLDNAITRMYGTFYVAFEIKPETGEIIDVDCSKTLELTKDFVRRLFIHKRIGRDSERIEKEIRRRYFGSSVKAIIVAYRDALKRYQELTDESEEPA